ncbi:MAG: hypothetical protein VX293_04065 [Candidatus Latescibacterota bacterium]|nr:hypothetical protein [Candidatus Latescibacterota bacterium]
MPAVDFGRLAGVAAGVVGAAVAHDLLVVFALGSLEADPLVFDSVITGRIDIGGQPTLEAGAIGHGLTSWNDGLK